MLYYSFDFKTHKIQGIKKENSIFFQIISLVPIKLLNTEVKTCMDPS